MRLEYVQLRIRELMNKFVADVDGATAQGDTFLNKLAETFLVPLLSETFDLPDLKNLNQVEKKNFPGIDLADRQARVAFQITSTPSSDKVKATLETFTQYTLYDHFDRLIIFIISQKQQSYAGNKYNTLTKGQYSFDKDNDILDSRDLLSTISGFDIDKAEKVLEILEKNYGDPPVKASRIPSRFTAKLDAVFAEVEKQLEDHSETTDAIIVKLIEICRDFLDRYLLNEAKQILSKIDSLRLETDDDVLKSNVDLLHAIFLIRTQQFSEAKLLLLQIIDTFPDSVEAMLEYVELCERIPESDDNAKGIEEHARKLAGDNPRILLIDLIHQYENHDVVEIPDPSKIWTDNKALNGRIICQYALICDFAQNLDVRDALVDRWENELPDSPRPILFRVLFKVRDFYRTPSLSLEEQSQRARDLLTYSINERKMIAAKDPLHLRDQVLWLMQEMQLQVDFPDENTNLAVLRDRMTSLIEQCYFDTFIDSILPEFLGRVRLETNQWEIITHKIQQSVVVPSRRNVELIFLQALQYDDIPHDLEGFISKYGTNDLPDILSALNKGDITDAATRINAKQDPLFTLYFLESVAKHEIAVDLSSLLEVEQNYEPELLYKRYQILDLHGKPKEAFEIIKTLPLDGLAPHVLHDMERSAHQNKEWDFFIPCALQLLKFNIPRSYKSQLHAGLAVAYFERGDDSNVIFHADQALSLTSDLGEENSQTLLHLLAQSHGMKGQYEAACDKFQRNAHIKRDFSLFLEEANLYLRSSIPDKHNKCLALIMQAFAEVVNPSDKHYLAALTFLLELGNAGTIPVQDEVAVKDGLFIKIDGFPTGWFYVGDEGKNLDAECINLGTPNYNAVINKTITDEIEWPADTYSKRGKRKLLHILTAPAYLALRATEAMLHAAEIGNGGAWSVQLGREDGSLDVDILNKFMQEHFRSSNAFFEQYVNTPLPFAFLCRVEGSLGKALGKIALERKGFIRFNNASPIDIDEHKAGAAQLLQGAACFMDGLSAYMLAEAGLLQDVITAMPSIGVSTSVIRMLREIADELDTYLSTAGWGAAVDGNFRFTPNSKENKESQETFRTRLLQAAELLDNLPNKVIGKSYPKSENAETSYLDNEMPDYFVDAIKSSQEAGAYVLCDDAILLQAYKQLGTTSMPKQVSSFNLVKALAEKNLISWQDYFKYVARLLSYRYHFLPITIGDMNQSVLPSSPSGLVTPAPQNIAYLNLQLVLSQEYGVDEAVAVSMLATFYTNLILDEALPQEMADEIFALTIKQGLAKRDRKTVANAIYQICQQNTRSRRLLSDRSKAKLTILGKHLFGFAQGIDPIAIDSTLFLRINRSRDGFSEEILN